MGYVNLTTGRIYGCKKGSLTWLHEKGHLYYNKQEWGQRLYSSRNNFQDLSLVFLALAVFSKWRILELAGIITISSWMGLYLFEEIYSWIYALKNYKGISTH